MGGYLQIAANGVFLEAFEKRHNFNIGFEVTQGIQIRKGFIHNHDDVRLLLCHLVVVFAGNHVVSIVTVWRNVTVFQRGIHNL